MDAHEFPALIYHNPACGTSRNTLALIRHAGVEPVVVSYLEQPPPRERILELVRKAGIPLREALRTKEPEYVALGLADPALGDDALLDAIARHPVLLQRPFVATPNGVRLCRPASERVLEILPPIATPFTKE